MQLRQLSVPLSLSPVPKRVRMDRTSPPRTLLRATSVGRPILRDSGWVTYGQPQVLSPERSAYRRALAGRDSELLARVGSLVDDEQRSANSGGDVQEVFGACASDMGTLEARRDRHPACITTRAVYSASRGASCPAAATVARVARMGLAFPRTQPNPDVRKCADDAGYYGDPQPNE